jgi:hypothetical protein
MNNRLRLLMGTFPNCRLVPAPLSMVAIYDPDDLVATPGLWLIPL